MGAYYREHISCLHRTFLLNPSTNLLNIKVQICVYWFGNFASEETNVLVTSTFLSCSTHKHPPLIIELWKCDFRNVSNDSMEGDRRKNFPIGSFILLHGQKDHHLINRNAAVYLHTLAKIFLPTLTSVLSIKKKSLLENGKTPLRDSQKFEN